MTPTIIFGAGGHARVVLDTLCCAGMSVFAFVDEHRRVESLDGVPVLGTEDPVWVNMAKFNFAVAIGDNRIRAAVFERLTRRGGIPLTALHPSAVVSRTASIGPGTVLMAGAIVNSGTQIGSNCILNTGCSVDHDCVVGDHAHLCPGVRVAGTVRIGEHTMLGTGSCVTPGRTIGSGTLVGAGSVVVCDLPSYCSAHGSPARVHRFIATPIT
jgi:sugar O-acyltransferase (sialic acid O-acetyltransferase NeuD family)